MEEKRRYLLTDVVVALGQHSRERPALQICVLRHATDSRRFHLETFPSCIGVNRVTHSAFRLRQRVFRQMSIQLTGHVPNTRAAFLRSGCCAIGRCLVLSIHLAQGLARATECPGARTSRRRTIEIASRIGIRAEERRLAKGIRHIHRVLRRGRGHGGGFQARAHGLVGSGRGRSVQVVFLVTRAKGIVLIHRTVFAIGFFQRHVFLQLQREEGRHVHALRMLLHLEVHQRGDARLGGERMTLVGKRSQDILPRIRRFTQRQITEPRYRQLIHGRLQQRRAHFLVYKPTHSHSPHTTTQFSYTSNDRKFPLNCE